MWGRAAQHMSPPPHAPSPASQAQGPGGAMSRAGGDDFSSPSMSPAGATKPSPHRHTGTSRHFRASSLSLCHQFLKNSSPATALAFQILSVCTVLALVVCLVAWAREGRADGRDPYKYKRVGTDFGGICATGESQSPINIVPGQAVRPLLGIPFSLNYQASLVSTLSVKNISFEIRPDASRPCFLAFSGETFKLLSVHAHAVSEHAFNGLLGPLEAHFVHESISTPGKLLVLGTFFSLHPTNQNNSFLQSFLNSVPPSPGASLSISTSLNFLSIIAPSGQGLPLVGTLPPVDIYTYSGSLTTPGCDEVVTWLVIEPSKGPTLSVEQWETFQILTSTVSGGVPVNNRPPQPRNGRVLRVFSTFL